ncbi:MAG TPA: hypothetical protein DCW68_06680 [Rhodospirillaceae bacterium]|nr:MAG: hypothetical protein A2018_01190 [Alphaproteobacteria bacterium GWF2_58_20]HAU29772.1 hypothetical protein [Rhodospirillaceae bacterium]
MAILACLPLSVTAKAANYEEIAALREQLATATLAVAELTTKAESLQQSLDILDRKKATKPDETSLSSQKDALQKERENINSSLPAIASIQSKMDADKEAVRDSYMELKGYIERLDRLQTQNVTKTILSLALETAQEIKEAINPSGKPVEIVKWAVEKAADPVVKAIVSYGGPEYYTRKMQGLSTQAASVTPELQRLKDLASLSLDGWRSYMVKYEDKAFEGNNGLILGKVRVLLEQAEKARWVLVDLYNQMDREIKDMDVDQTNLKELLAEIDKQLADLDAQDKTTKSDIWKNLASEKEKITQELSDIKEKLATEKQKLANIQNKLKSKINQQDTSPIEDQVANYKTLHKRLTDSIPGYQAQADMVEANLDSATNAYAAIPEMKRDQQKEMDEVVGWTLEHPTYPYPTEGMTDKTALENTRKYQENWMKTRERHLAEKRTTANQMDGLANSLEAEINATPNDPTSEHILRNALSTAGSKVYTALQEALRVAYENSHGFSNSTTQRLEKLRAEMKALLDTPLPASPYAKSKTIAQENLNLSNDIAYVAQTTILHLRNYAQRELAALQEEGRFLDGQKKEQAKTLDKYQKEIASRQETYRYAAKTFLNQGSDYLRRLEDLLQARQAYSQFLDSAKKAGILEKTDANGYRISQEWINTTVKNTSMTCPAVDLLQEKLSSRAAQSSRLFSQMMSAQRLSNIGTSGAPLSDWAKTNESGLYSSVESLNRQLEQARHDLAQIPQTVIQDPITTFSNSISSNNAFLIGSSSELFTQMQKTSRELEALVKIAILEAEHYNKAARMTEEEQKKMRDWVAQLKKRQQTDFGCFDSEHAFNKNLTPKIDELAELVKKLAKKPLYVDGQKTIADLKTLLTDTRNLFISYDDGYKKAVSSLRTRLYELETPFLKNEKGFSPGDVTTIRQHLHDIGEALRAHEIRVLDMQSRPESISNPQIQALYQSFITAYGASDLRGILALLGPDWQGGDGSDARDVEEYLSNSFRVFDRIQYKISGFTAKTLGDGSAQVSYSVKIAGENRRQHLTHEEESQIVEQVGLVDGQPRILRTISGNQWLR